MLLFIHTQKAVNTGAPGNRLFVVSETYKEGRRTCYVAWKCSMSSNGISHPGIKGSKIPQTVGDWDVLTASTASNGACPTADFYKDSFYQQVTQADVLKLIAAMPKRETSQKAPYLKVTSAMPYGPETTSSNLDWINFRARVEPMNPVPMTMTQKAGAIALFEKFIADLKNVE